MPVTTTRRLLLTPSPPLIADHLAGDVGGVVAGQEARPASATSAGSPRRRIGISLVSSSTRRSASSMSVSMRPGATAFTVTLRLASSCASERVAPIRPAFAAE